MRAKIRRLVGLLCSLGLALVIAAPLWAGSATYDYDDFGRLIEVLYDDGTRIVYTYDDAGNRLTQVITVAAPEADLGLTIIDSPDPVVQGSNVTYSVTVTNNGPDTASGATLTATLPANVTLFATIPSQGTCDTVVSCNLGAIASLGSATVTIEVIADASGTISYPMSISAIEADPTPANDSATATTTVTVPLSADLQIAVADGPDPVVQGNNVTYSVTITNNGPDAATGATLAATLPMGVTLISTTPSQGTCDTAVSCPLGTIAVMGSVLVDIVVSADSTGSIDYPMSISAAEADPAPANDSQTATTTVNAPLSADLQIAIADSPDPVVQGNNVTYSVTVTNNGPDGASSVSLDAFLPGNVTYISATPSQGTCDTLVLCDLGVIASLGTATVDITVSADASGTISFPMSISASEADPTPANDSATATTTVTVPLSADLQIAVADSPDPVVQGSNVTYSVTITNNGPDGATGATLTAVLPGNVSYVSATPSQGSCDTAVSCSLGSIASLGSATVSIVVSADASGTISYPMSVSATEADPTPANDSATATTTVDTPPSGDVIVDDLDPNTSQTGTWKVSTDLSSYSGQTLFADKAATFRWLPTIPQQGTYAVYAWWVFHNKNAASVPYEISHAGGTNIINVNQHDSALAGQWNLLGSFSFNAGAGAWVEISRPSGRVYADAVRFVLAGGSPSADLSVAMTDAPDPVTEGSDITYTATVTNNGPDGATNVTLTDSLPAGLTLVSAIPSQGSCSGDPNISCALGALAASVNATVTIVATANSAGTVNNTASVSATEADPQSSNDSATASTTVNAPGPSADLSVAVVDAPDPVPEGDNVTYSVTVTNNGPDGATGVNLAATLPGNVTLVSATPSQGSCDVVVSCSLGNIASLGSATVSVVVSADAAGTITYPLSVSATEADPTPANDSATATTTVDPLPGGDIIVDNQDAGGTQIGSWNVSTDTASFAGQSLWSKKANARFEWHFTIPATGGYQVFAWWVDRAQISTTAPYTIHHAGGPTTITVDQSPAALEGQWNLLGTFTFNAGTSHFVEIDTTNGLVSADAIKLVAN